MIIIINYTNTLPLTPTGHPVALLHLAWLQTNGVNTNKGRCKSNVLLSDWNNKYALALLGRYKNTFG